MVVGGCGDNISREVYQYTLNGNLIQKWDSVINLAEAYGTTVNSPYTALQFRESFRDTFLSYDYIIIQENLYRNLLVLMICKNILI